MSLFNRKDSYDVIAKRIYTVVKEIDAGNLCEEYLEVELYGCLEKNEKNWIKVRVSEKAFDLLKDKIQAPKKEYGEQRYIPKKIKKGTHPEHVLPRSMLKELLISEFLKKPENITEDKIKDFLVNNCKGVIITKEECNLLDKGKDNLKDRMPDGWKLGDCVEKRLESKNIKIHDEYFTVTDF